MKIFQSITMVAILAGLLCAPGAFATILTPIGVATNPIDDYGATCSDGATVCTTPTTAVTIGSIITSSGFAAANPPSGSNIAGNYVVGYGVDGVTGKLDFLYQFDPTQSVLENLSGAMFASTLALTVPGTIGVGYYSRGELGDLSYTSGTHFAAPGNTCGPTFNSDCIGTNAKWDGLSEAVTFGVNNVYTGVNSAVLVIRTNATTATLTGVAGYIDASTTNSPAYEPAPEPAWAGLLLSGLFGFGLLIAKRFQVLQS